MKLSKLWLAEFIKLDLDAKQLADQLTMIGIEVANITKAALDDEILELELTAQRGDCLSILGIAREIAALNRRQVNSLKIPQINATQDGLPLTITAPDACPHYAGRIIRGINNNIPTPDWMAKRLRNADIEPISLIVDITNYVMLELGQPLHAFDLKKIQGGITIRYAKPKESLELLNNQQLNLQPENLVIADESKCLALAGVMGGNESKVTTDTCDIFLESAFFIPEKIARQTHNLGLLTDASHRYTHGVDYNLPIQSLERTTALVVKLAGGTPGQVSEFISKKDLPQLPIISLPRQALQEIVGITLPDKEILTILSGLGIQLKDVKSSWQAQIPSWRVYDLKATENLVAEIARIYGYQHIPEQEIIIPMAGAPIKSQYNDLERIRSLLEDRGYYETITYSFIDEKSQTLLSNNEKSLPITNPLSQEQSVMRTSLWPGLINVLQHNTRRQAQRARLFEIGLCFKQTADKLEQPLLLAGLTYGELYAKQWGITGDIQNDFYDLKNDLYSIMQLFVPKNEIEFINSQHQALHPGRTAQILVNKKPVGYLGELHPAVKMNYTLEHNACIFEIDLSIINNELYKRFNEYSSFPCISRDIAIVVNRNTPWQQIKQQIIKIGGETLRCVLLFDIYHSKDLGDDKQSLAIRLTFQSVNRTLKDDEIKKIVVQVITALQESFGATLRE